MSTCIFSINLWESALTLIHQAAFYFLVTFPRCPFAGENIYSYLHSHLSSLAKTLAAVDLLTSGVHVWPDFHGNRSPLADPSLKGMVEPLFCTSNLPCALIKTSWGPSCSLFLRR